VRPARALRGVAAAVAIATCLWPAGGGAQINDIPIRIGLIDGAQSVEIAVNGGHTTYAADGRILFRAELGIGWRLTAGRSGTVVVEHRDLEVAEIRIVPDPGARVSVRGRPYRGDIRILARASGLTVVNRLGLEEYLLGVVPVEMPPSWPLEALKAQAVIARTYAIRNLGQFESASYDLCADQRCQVYAGLGAESERTTRAVGETRGLIALWQDRPAATFYHSDSGGHTASSAEVWGGELPYLPGVLDPYGTASPRRTWTFSLRAGVLGQYLSAMGRPVGEPRALNLAGYSASGRVTVLTVTGTAGRVELTGPELRGLLQRMGIFSTRLRLDATRAESETIFILSGSGWGHGVGLSQWGAREMADRGMGFERILAHYYPGISLGRYHLP
jgi:stage II sporulation protein D